MCIVHQHQPDKSTCVSTCLAMVMGLPADLVVSEFHDQFMNYEIEPDTYAGRHNVILQRCNTNSRLESDKVYMLTVPSLNSPAHFHYVIADTRNGQLKIYDPARVGCRRYVAPGEACEPGETEIISWIADWEVKHSPAIGVTLERFSGTRC